MKSSHAALRARRQQQAIAMDERRRDELVLRVRKGIMRDLSDLSVDTFKPVKKSRVRWMLFGLSVYKPEQYAIRDDFREITGAYEAWHNGFSNALNYFAFLRSLSKAIGTPDRSKYFSLLRWGTIDRLAVICPVCGKHPRLKHSDDIIELYCKCGHHAYGRDLKAFYWWNRLASKGFPESGMRAL